MPGGCVYMSWLSEVADGVATVSGELPDQMHVDAAQRPTQAGMRHRVVEDEAGLDQPRSVARHSVFCDDICDGLLRAELPNLAVSERIATDPFMRQPRRTRLKPVPLNSSGVLLTSR